MMMEQDYIKRMIQQISIVLAKILGLKDKKNYEEALQITNETLKKYIGLDSKALSLLSYRDLIKIINYGDVLDIGKGILICEMLKAEGDIFVLKNSLSESYNIYLKSLNIYIYMIIENNIGYDLTSYYSSIDYIIDKIQSYKLPLDTQFNLLAFYEKIGRYSKAEDIIFQSIEDYKENKEEIINKGIAFYRRLKNKSKEDLIKGHLPIDEVEESLAELEAMTN